MIGKSRFGKVMLVKGKESGVMYALKVIKKTEIRRVEKNSKDKSTVIVSTTIINYLYHILILSFTKFRT